jgi:hypothetical protein
MIGSMMHNKEASCVLIWSQDTADINQNSVLHQAYAILRQRYMIGGEALVNQWHDRILTSNANSTLHAKASSGANAMEGHGMWTAVRELLGGPGQVSQC